MSVITAWKAVRCIGLLSLMLGGAPVLTLKVLTLKVLAQQEAHLILMTAGDGSAFLPYGVSARGPLSRLLVIPKFPSASNTTSRSFVSAFTAAVSVGAMNSTMSLVPVFRFANRTEESTNT